MEGSSSTTKTICFSLFILFIFSSRQSTQIAARDKPVGFDDRLCESAGGFLGQVMPDSAVDKPMRISFAREFARIGAAIRMRCTIGIAFEGDGRHGDDRTDGKPLFKVSVLRLAVGNCEAPP